ncbi:MAG: hypothetical protein SA339_02775 [Methanomassiliicoccus sp.]|nr:hypothetical protein [Methanomassiliicoccus sp.]
MTKFASRTGLEPEGAGPRRYLWTDSFAVCNFLELHRLTGEDRFRRLALRLVDQVHRVLGRHRGDDGRRGWISGLPEDEGREHPTAGGLRIGKKVSERAPGESMDPREEWDRDGQYLHYLTKWMHALARVSEVAAEPRYLRWAIELAAVAQERFAYNHPSGGRRMFWKMSIGLDRPLVLSMGQHDALDAFVTYRELQLAEEQFPEASFPDLGPAIEDATAMCRKGSWATDDPLGVGSLLIDAWRVASMEDGTTLGLLRHISAESAVSMAAVGEMDCDIPATHRLAFRELGLSIGLHAAERLDARPGGMDEVLADEFDILRSHAPLGRRIEAFWSDLRNRDNDLWREHEDIDTVMLATSLVPDGFLRVWVPAEVPIMTEERAR